MMSDRKFIFVGGVPRSGTSLVQKILDLNSKVFAGPELGILNPFSVLYERMNFECENNKTSVYYNTNELRSICSSFVAKLLQNSISEDIDTVSEKTPDNLFAFNSLVKLFPEAKFIWVVRDPRSNIASFKKVQKNAIGANKSTVFGETTMGDLNIIQRYFKTAESFDQRVLDNMLVVYYEDLVLDPQKEIENMCQFLGIDFQMEMLETTKENSTSLAIKKFKPAKEVFYNSEMFDRNIDTSRLNSWQDEITSSELNLINNYFIDNKFDRLDRYDFGEKVKLPFITKAKIKRKLIQIIENL